MEPGLAWVAGYVSFLDATILRQGYELPARDGELPSFYCHRNLVHGARNLMWSSDYPHPVST